MRRDLKDRLMERLTNVLGPMRYCSIIQVSDVIDLVEEIVDNDADWQELAYTMRHPNLRPPT